MYFDHLIVYINYRTINYRIEILFVKFVEIFEKKSKTMYLSFTN